MRSLRSNAVLLLLSILVVISEISCRKIAPTVLPSLTTLTVSGITMSSAVSGGNITSEGSAPVTTRGVCWSTVQNPTTENHRTTDGSGTGQFISIMAGLSPGITYYVRSYAITTAGTAYGNELSFTTQSGGETVTDIDGNLYHIKTIAKQVWIVENLKVTRYRNGEPISNITDATEWSNTTAGAWCDYKNSATYDTSGHLYNGYAISDQRSLCPEGWHVPTDDEWKTLIFSVGDASNAGGRMKSAGTLEMGTGLWHDPNTGASNESGFTALPGGYRSQSGGFDLYSYNAFFWSSSEKDLFSAWDREMTYKYESIDRMDKSKSNGFSVRCIRDEKKER